MKYLLSVGIMLSSLLGISQNAYVDSCMSLQGHDTLKINCTQSYVSANYKKDPKTCVDVLKQQLALAEGLNDLKQIEETEGWLGYMLLQVGQLEEAQTVNFSCLNNRQQLGDARGVTNVLNNIGATYKAMELYDSALWAYKSSVELMEELQDTAYLITGHNNIAGIYSIMGKINKSVESWMRTIKLSEQMGDTVSLARSYTGLASTYARSAKFEFAVSNFKRSIELFKMIDQKMSVIQGQNSLASTYVQMGESELAIELFEEVKVFVTEKNILPGIASVASSLGNLEYDAGNYEKSLKHYLEAVSTYRKMNRKTGLSSALSGAGKAFIKLNNPAQGIVYLEESEALAKEISAINQLKYVKRTLAHAYFESGQYAKSSQYYKDYVDLRDSLATDEQKKEIEALSAKFETEKKELMIDNLTKNNELLAKDQALKSAQLSEQRSRIAADEETKKRKDQQLIAIGVGLVLALVLAGLAFKGYRDKQQANKFISEQKEEVEKQRDLAERQKELVEEKNQEITDSINYAQRLQQAILPSPAHIKKHLPDSFILYKPKDIVAGDFYWIEELNGKVYFAAADCTGHGVPGAMVSVVCSNALNKSLMELHKHEPNEILESTRELVVETFSKSGDDVKDGMDISLAVWDKKTNELTWSGANNPLWIIRETENKTPFELNNDRFKVRLNDQENLELLEVKADKQPVGKDDRNAPFTKQTVQLIQGDTVYLFSDGVQDQFGGTDRAGKGKKFKVSSMRQLFFANFDKAMADQSKIIEKAFLDWMGNFEQLDDVCIVAVKVA